jgi:hypothetical protein
MELTKVCTGCKEEKTLDNFYNHKQYIRKYDKVNREKKNGYNSKWLRKSSEELRDLYVRRQIQKMLHIPTELIPQELVELKRIQLKTYRLCQQLQN